MRHHGLASPRARSRGGCARTAAFLHRSRRSPAGRLRRGRCFDFRTRFRYSQLRNCLGRILPDCRSWDGRANRLIRRALWLRCYRTGCRRRRLRGPFRSETSFKGYRTRRCWSPWHGRRRTRTPHRRRSSNLPNHMFWDRARRLGGIRRVKCLIFRRRRSRRRGSSPLLCCRSARLPSWRRNCSRSCLVGDGRSTSRN